MTEKFTYQVTDIDGLFHLQRRQLRDDRGSFERLFCLDELAPWGGREIKQINQTITKRSGTIRGLHFQFGGAAECKYVTCLRGAVFDVAVDLRRSSKTYGQWFGCELSGAKHNALLIPEGFAHGFQTLQDDVMMLYLHSAPYTKQLEAGVHPFDEELKITWPLPATTISERDKSLPLLSSITGLNL